MHHARVSRHPDGQANMFSAELHQKGNLERLKLEMQYDLRGDVSQPSKGAVSSPGVPMLMEDSLEEIPQRDSVFGKLCKRALEKRNACFVPAELKGL